MSMLMSSGTISRRTLSKIRSNVSCYYASDSQGVSHFTMIPTTWATLASRESVAERIILHLQSILSLIQERNQYSPQISSQNRWKGGYDASKSETFIVAYNSTNYINAMLLTKQMIDYTQTVSDPQVQIVFSGRGLSKAFLLRIRNYLLRAKDYKKTSKSHCVNLFGGRNRCFI
jgi:hypothetical protein